MLEPPHLSSFSLEENLQKLYATMDVSHSAGLMGKKLTFIFIKDLIVLVLLLLNSILKEGL